VALDRLRSIRLAEQANHRLAGADGVRARVFTHPDRIEVRYTINPSRRGRYSLGPVAATRTDVFGLVRSTTMLGAPDDVLVWPRTTAVPVRSEMLGDLERAGVGSRLPSLDDSILREYVAGDDPRRVHWLSAARLGNLMVRTDEAAGPRPVTVLFDRSLIRSADDWAVEMAASVACSLIDAGHSTRFVSSGSTEPGQIEHVKGATAQGELLDSTVDLVAPGTGAAREIFHAVRSLRSSRGRDDVVVAVLSAVFGDDLSELAALGMEAAAGWALVTGGVDAEATVATLRRGGWVASRVTEGDDPAKAWTALTERMS
jgi:uncharacterized protein (DUF58 family)